MSLRQTSCIIVASIAFCTLSGCIQQSEEEKPSGQATESAEKTRPPVAERSPELSGKPVEKAKAVEHQKEEPVGERVAANESGNERPLPTERVFNYNNLGIAYLEQYKYTQAIHQFQRAVEQAPGFALSHVNLAIAFYNAGNRDHALAELQTAERQGSHQPQVYFMQGLIYKDRGDFDRALQFFHHVLELDPNDVVTNYHIGAIYARKGQHTLAARYYRKALAAEPYNSSARYGLAISLLREGKTEQGRAEMTAFQKLQKKAYATHVGQQYMEQGQYATAIERFASTPPEAVAVTFSEVSTSAGIQFNHGAHIAATGSIIGHTISATEYSFDYARRHLIPALGSGAVFFDYNNDGQLDIYMVNCSAGGQSQNALYRNDGDGRFTDVTRRADVGYAGLGMGVVAGDYDNDGWVDLYITNYGRNILYHNSGDGTFTDVTDQAGVGGERSEWGLSAAFVDYDHDGDLDIYVTNFVDLKKPPKPTSGGTFVFPDDFTPQANRLYRNNGNGTFTETASKARLALHGRSTSVVCTDYDNSRDIDFLVVNHEGPAHLLSNNRDGTFTDVTAAAGLTIGGGIFSAAVGDVNKDGYSDIFIARAGDANLLFESQGSNSFKKSRIPADRTTPHASIAWMGHFIDYDNDGYLDLFVINGGTSQEEAASQRLQLLRNMGDGRFRDVSARVGLQQLPPSLARGAAFGDYDNDGDVDVLVMQNGGRPWLLKNAGGNRNNWVKINTLGVRSNKLGIGAKVEVKAGRVWQKVEVSGGSGYLSQSSQEVIFGLGRHQEVDFVRVLWPGGVLQSELKVASNRLVKVKELDRKGTSCPILYAWNGHQYNFVTDFLGGSAIGYLETPDTYNYPDTDEYVKVSGSQLMLKDGAYLLKMNNQLEEVVMFDQTELFAIDHPADVDVYPNERLMPVPPYPEFAIYAVTNARPPVAALDDKGHNILPRITAVDRTYPDDFDLLPFKGYAAEHSIVLDLGQLRDPHSAPDRRNVVLLLTAWIDYADSSSNLAASQAGVRLIPPFLQVPDERGQWTTVIPSMGFPAGLPKTMTVDLTGKFLTDDHRVKITTSMRIYWDQILFSDQCTVTNGSLATNDHQESRSLRSHRGQLRVTELKLRRADLHWRGYPKEFSPDGKKPLIYDYNEIAPHAPWKTFVGSVTRYGDVADLLVEKDDLYVITLHGDELSLEFDGRRLPALPPGWTRDFFVYADGFGKDMDLNSARPDTIAPLPFHGMSGYPYSNREGYPMDERHREYLQRYNRRHFQDPLEETDAKKSRRRGMM